MSQQAHNSSERRRGHGIRRLALAAAVAGVAAALPAHADPVVQSRNVGGGASIGSIVYVGTPMPPVLAACKATTFTFEAGSAAFVFNTVVSGYAGPVTIQGNGAGNCESATVGGGEMQLSLVGTNDMTESRLACPSLVGIFTRVLSDMTLILSGNCTVNAYAQGIVTFVARLQLVPTGGGAGFLAPVTSAAADGTFVIAPA